MTSLRSLSSLGVVAGLLLASAPVFAQYGSPPPPPPPGYGSPPPPGYYPPPPPPPPSGTYRDGFIVGLSLGGGSMKFADAVGNESDSFNGVSFQFHLGGMIMPNFALVLEGWGVSHPEDGYSISTTIGTIAGRFFVDQLWLQVGLGGGQVSINFDNGLEAESDTGGAIMLGVGYDIFSNGNFAFDVSARFGYASIKGSNDTELNFSMGSINLGINWY